MSWKSIASYITRNLILLHMLCNSMEQWALLSPHTSRVESYVEFDLGDLLMIKPSDCVCAYHCHMLACILYNKQQWHTVFSYPNLFSRRHTGESKLRSEHRVSWHAAAWSKVLRVSCKGPPYQPWASNQQSYNQRHRVLNAESYTQVFFSFTDVVTLSV